MSFQEVVLRIFNLDLRDLRASTRGVSTIALCLLTCLCLQCLLAYVLKLKLTFLHDTLVCMN